VLGWAAVVLPFILLTAWTSITTPSQTMLAFVSIGVTAGMGLPVAFAACWVVGGPIIWHLMARQVTWRSAARWGVAIPLLMEFAVALILGVSYLVEDSPAPPADPSVWWFLPLGAVLFVLIGSGAALIVRRVIGPGRPAEESIVPSSP
jgi:hypothetical protein